MSSECRDRIEDDKQELVLFGALTGHPNGLIDTTYVPAGFSGHGANESSTAPNDPPHIENVFACREPAEGT